MMRLVLIRHGESTWNQLNLFTGWTDVPLSDKGITEATEAGILLKEKNFTFDIAYNSVLTRANETLHLVLKNADQLWIPVIKSWRLNERHYGALQGLNKEETAEKYSAEQVHIWRRSYDVLPPLLEDNDTRLPHQDRRYQYLDQSILPRGESLALTLKRVLPFWEDYISISLLEGKEVLVVAHGNSLRALIKYLEKLSDNEIVATEIPTGNPLVYELGENFKVLNKYYLK